MAIDESTLQTEHDVLQSMKLEGIFDELRLACRELLYKDASYGPVKNNLDEKVESFLTQQNWKNASDYREKTRKVSLWWNGHDLSLKIWLKLKKYLGSEATCG